MDAPFPFGLPFPTAFYLTIYLVTLMVHIVFMNYVLAGSAYLAAASVMRGMAAEESPIYRLLRDWMPFMLSAAITAGIAPLLFLQVLYKEQFYTANLLLFYRWMAMLPALILGFYLAYLLKTKLVRGWPLIGRIAVGGGVFACFAFVGWSWVENHLLSLRPKSEWTAWYGSGEVLFRSPELVPRLVLWFTAAFPTMALVVGWQIYCSSKDWSERTTDAESRVEHLPGSRRTSFIALAGIVVSSAAAGTYFVFLSPAARGAITGVVGFIYLLFAIGGGTIQFVAWLPQFWQQRLSKFWLTVASVGLVINFIGMAVVNEATRLASLDISTLFDRHRQAWRIGGFPVFVAFFVINLALMAYCVTIVGRHAKKD